MALHFYLTPLFHFLSSYFVSFSSPLLSSLLLAYLCDSSTVSFISFRLSHGHAMLFLHCFYKSILVLRSCTTLSFAVAYTQDSTRYCLAPSVSTSFMSQ